MFEGVLCVYGDCIYHAPSVLDSISLRFANLQKCHWLGGVTEVNCTSMNGLGEVWDGQMVGELLDPTVLF